MNPVHAVRLAMAAGAVAALVTGCGTMADVVAPTCTAERLEPLILMAQSVPTASRVPCIASYPAGWELAGVHVRSGRSRFTLDSDRAGRGALRVTLEHTCDVTSATEVPTDEPDTRRYERILAIDEGFSSVRSYKFDGGCVTYRFTFDERGQALVNEASVAIGFVARTEVDRRLRLDSNNRLKL